MKPRSIAFVLPYGEPRDGFFPDGLAGLLCQRARDLGHRAEIVRVYYHGRDAHQDDAIRIRMERWLEEREVDLVVVERLFDGAPIRGHLARDARRTSLLVTRGEPFTDPDGALEWVIGLATAPTRAGHRRSPEVGELVASFGVFLERLGAALDPFGAPGVSRLALGTLEHGPPSTSCPLARPIRVVLEHATIAPGPPPPVRRKTLFGNAGCPYGSDPLEARHHRGLRLPTAPAAPLARLGCSFCSMGGDYQKRPDPIVVEELLEQARAYLEALPEVDELVLSDQHALRYLEALMERAASLRPARWLFPARADAFVRERPRIERAIEAARRSGHRLEVHLSGFEAFSDRELERYHKGADRATLLAAVQAMRALHEAHADVFHYAEARGHSLILYNPWTTPEDVRESVDTLREHGLAELFDELGRNRLRLYDGLPITLAAERDGALTDAWEAGDEGAGRRKGYASERPWRFLDARTRDLRLLAEALRERLGAETEVAQLRAASALAASGSLDVEAILEGVARLHEVLARRTRGAHRGARAVPFAGPCNDGCPACPNRDRYASDEAGALLARIDLARASGSPLVLAGREPTVHPAFGELLRRAHGPDGRPVGLVTNGRRFAYRAFAKASVNAGLWAASVKLFAPEAGPADAICRVQGAHEQTLSGLRALRSAGVEVLEVRAPVHALTLGSLPRYVMLAENVGADSLFVEVALDALGLERAAEAAGAIEALLAECDARGLPVESAPLESGTRRFDRLPTRRTRGPGRSSGRDLR